MKDNLLWKELTDYLFINQRIFFLFLFAYRINLFLFLKN